MVILVNVRLIGSGTNADPLRANLPTGHIATVDNDNKVAVFATDSGTLGLSADDLKDEQAHPTTEGDLYTQLSVENLQKVEKHLVKAYPTHAYTLDLVGR